MCTKAAETIHSTSAVMYIFPMLTQDKYALPALHMTYTGITRFDVEADSGDEEAGVVVGQQTFGGRIVEVDTASMTVSCQTRSDGEVENVAFDSARIVWVRPGERGDGWSEESSSGEEETE